MPASRLELPPAREIHDVLGGAEGEALNGERRRIPSALAGENACVSNEEVRYVMGTTVGGYDRGAWVGPHPARASNMGGRRHIIDRSLLDHLDGARRLSELLEAREHGIEGNEISLGVRRLHPGKRNAIGILRVGQRHAVPGPRLLLGDAEQGDEGAEV